MHGSEAHRPRPPPSPPETSRASRTAILQWPLPELVPTWRRSGFDPGSWVLEEVPDFSPLLDPGSLHQWPSHLLARVRVGAEGKHTDLQGTQGLWALSPLTAQVEGTVLTRSGANLRRSRRAERWEMLRKGPCPDEGSRWAP